MRWIVSSHVLILSVIMFAAFPAHAAEKDKNDKKDKDKKEDRLTPFEKALIEAKAFDKEHAPEIFNFEVSFENLRYLTENLASEKKPAGAIKIHEGFVVRSNVESPAAKGPEGEVKQERKGFYIHFYTYYKKDGLVKLNDCRKLAQEALNNKGVLKVTGQFKRNRVIISEQELLRHWGWEKFQARLFGKKLSKEQRSLKRYVKNIGDEEHIRGGIAIHPDTDDFKCELVPK